MRVAKQGDIVYRVVCRCDQQVLVNQYSLATWYCTCRAKRPLKTHRIVLGPGGSLPPPEEWQELPEPLPIH